MQGRYLHLLHAIRNHNGYRYETSLQDKVRFLQDENNLDFPSITLGNRLPLPMRYKLLSFPCSSVWKTTRFIGSSICCFVVLLIQITEAKSSILQESLASIQSKALAGDVHYQGALAIFHKFGEKGLAVDLIEAERWAKLAAEKRGSIGLCTLAALELEKGNSERGRFLYDEAYLNSNLRSVAKHHDPIALFCMGMIEIDNPPRNFAKGIRELSKSAELGFATAQATLGMIYFSGIGVKKDPQSAIKWCSRAARDKLPLGMFYLGMAYSIGDASSKTMTTHCDGFELPLIVN